MTFMAKLYERTQSHREKVRDLSLKLLNIINRNLQRREIDLSINVCQFSLPVVVEGERFQYLHDGIKLVEKTFKPYGWNCKMTHYTRKDGDEGDEQPEFWYTFTFTRNKKPIPCDDLPF